MTKLDLTDADTAKTEPPGSISSNKTLATFECFVDLPANIETCFAYHERPGALSRLIPPWESVAILRSDNSLSPGSEVLLRSYLMGIPLDWLARHESLDRPRAFVDYQVSGPFSFWRHSHVFENLDNGQTRLKDRIDYRIPFGLLGEMFAGDFIRRKLDAMFSFRHRITRQDLEFDRTLASTAKIDKSPKRIAVTGSYGLIGSQVVSLLGVLGHQVIRLERPGRERRPSIADHNQPSLRANSSTSSVTWDPEKGLEDPEQLSEVDAVIHLAGKSIAESRWTETTKAALIRSRVRATRLLADQLAKLSQPPKSFVSASGIGYYGDRGATEVDETEPASHDFLGQLAQAWEQASQPLADAGTRVCVGRFGVVLSAQGGALRKMLPLIRWGVGGRLGSGRQYWSWIGHEDAASALVWLALNPECQGPYNLVAGSVTNATFTRQLASALRRPAIFPVPALGLRIMMGEMADGLLLNSTRASARRILASGYPMRQSDLLLTFRELLGVQSA